MSDENLNISCDAQMVARANEVLRDEIARLRTAEVGYSQQTADALKKERAALQAENERLRAENKALQKQLSQLHAALYLASEDVLWFHSQEDDEADSEWLVGVINCNDVFYYATADGEALAPGEFMLARDVYDTYGYHGLVALAALRRKTEPLEPLRTPEYYAALKSLETDAELESSNDFTGK